MNLGGRARHLTNVDGDEVSLVARAANKRRFLLKKGDEEMLNPELAEFLNVPAENEGGFTDLVRKDGGDETTELAALGALRLLSGIRDDLSRETIEKLGHAIYPTVNNPLNEGAGAAGETLNHVGEDEDSEFTDDVDPADFEKRDFSDSDRKRDADSGAAESDGSYPIENKGDLSNAISAFGRSKNKGKTKAHIIARAKALGATGLLPKGWSVSKSNDDTHEGGDPVEAHAVPIQKEDGTWDLTGVPAESRPFYEATLSKADALASELEATKDRLTKADEKTATLADALKTKELVQKAEAEYGHVAPATELAKILKAAQETMDEETYTSLESILKAADAKIETGDLFTELGRSGHGDTQKPGSAYAEAVSKADEMVEKGDAKNRDVAIGRVFETNPALYNRYMAENQQLWNATPNPALAAAYAAGGEQ